MPLQVLVLCGATGRVLLAGGGEGSVPSLSLLVQVCASRSVPTNLPSLQRECAALHIDLLRESKDIPSPGRAASIVSLPLSRLS